MRVSASYQWATIITISKGHALQFEAVDEPYPDRPTTITAKKPWAMRRGSSNPNAILISSGRVWVAYLLVVDFNFVGVVETVVVNMVAAATGARVGKSERIGSYRINVDGQDLGGIVEEVRRERRFEREVADLSFNKRAITGVLEKESEFPWSRRGGAWPDN